MAAHPIVGNVRPAKMMVEHKFRMAWILPVVGHRVKVRCAAVLRVRFRRCGRTFVTQVDAYMLAPSWIWRVAMGWFERRRRSRAAKRYALQLPRCLDARYGHSQFYTPAQIKITVETFRLDADYIGIAYAVFLPEADFEALQSSLAVQIDYDQANAIFARFLPDDVNTDWEPIGSSAGVNATRLPLP